MPKHRGSNIGNWRCFGFAAVALLACMTVQAQMADMDLLGSTSLADAVREFNLTASRDPIGREQPLLTQDEVIAAFRWDCLQRDKFPGTDEGFETYREFARVGRLPRGARLRAMTRFMPGDEFVYSKWSVRLKMHLKEGGRTYGLIVRDRIIDSRRVSQEELLALKQRSSEMFLEGPRLPSGKNIEVREPSSQQLSDYHFRWIWPGRSGLGTYIAGGKYVFACQSPIRKVPELLSGSYDIGHNTRLGISSVATDPQALGDRMVSFRWVSPEDMLLRQRILVFADAYKLTVQISESPELAEDGRQALEITFGTMTNDQGGRLSIMEHEREVAREAPTPISLNIPDTQSANQSLLYECELPGEETYRGYILNGYPHGEGTMTWPDGRCYTGTFHQGHLHGRGTMVYPDKSKYDGEWRNSQRSGTGILLEANGDKYEGGWLNDLQHGSGTLTLSIGVITGEFSDGKPHEGYKQTWGDGTIFEGDNETGHARGTAKLPNGTVVSGEWGNINRGTIRYADGRVYEGEWEWERGAEDQPADARPQERPNGLGTMTLPDGYRQEGLWRQGQFVGKAIKE